MHEATQRLFCRVGFLLLCVAPTTAVLGWGIARKTPGHVREQEQQLSELLGLQTTVAGVSHPRPGVVLYEGLRLSDPETGEVVLKCRLLEVEHYGGGMAVTASQPEVYAARVEPLQRILTRWLRREIGSDGNLELLAREAIWRVAPAQGPETAVTLTAVKGALLNSSTESEAQFSFHWAGQRSDEPIELRLARTRQTSPPAMEFSLKTGDTPLPCLLLNPLVDAASWLGPESKFRGTVRAIETAEGWKGDLQGALSQVDLQTLLSERFPHRLSGPAEIEIERALFDDGRLTEGSLELSAGPGVIGKSLLVAAYESLHMGAPESYPIQGPLTRYEKLAFKVELDADGLRIAGQADPRIAGALLFDAQRVLLFEPQTQPQPVAAFVRMLVPANEVQVPASRETQWLIERLPVPHVTRPKNADGSEPKPAARPRFGGAVGNE